MLMSDGLHITNASGEFVEKHASTTEARLLFRGSELFSLKAQDKHDIVCLDSVAQTFGRHTVFVLMQI